MQFIDSQIAEAVMIKLLDNTPQITALPIHDSFIVRRGGEDALLNVMNEAFREVVGVEVMIDKNETIYDLPEGYEGNGLIWGHEIHDDVKNHIISHSLYHKREHEWKEVWGTEGVE